jgi:hypothetical protein
LKQMREREMLQEMETIIEAHERETIIEAHE